jgi:hypothetical protein
VLAPVLIVLAIGAVLLIPSLWWLYSMSSATTNAPRTIAGSPVTARA